VSSERQIAEVSQAFAKPLLAPYGLAPSDVFDVVQFLTTSSELVPPDSLDPERISPLRNPNDAHILAAAIAGGADYLVTGDRDLLVLGGDPALGSLRIVTPAEFLALLAPIEG